MTRHRKPATHGSSGLTLLELLIVLAILLALGTVMVTQSTSLTDEARFQGTIRRLEQLDDAVIGRVPVGAEDPTGIAPGFVSDMGRLPIAVNGSLAELWDVTLFADPDPLVDATFRARPIQGLDSDLLMWSGWRGPYVRLPIGASELTDGWGRPFTLVDAPDSPAGTVGRVTSEGSLLGDAFDPATFDAPTPLEVVFSGVEGIERSGGSLPTLEVSYVLGSTTTESEYAVVRLYGITNGVPDLLFQSEVIKGNLGATELLEVEFELPSPLPGADPIPLDLAKGPKVLVVYQLEDAMSPPEDPMDPRADLASREKSVLRFTLPAGGLSTLPTMTLTGI